LDEEWLSSIISLMDKVRWELEKARWELNNWDIEAEWFNSDEGREHLENTKRKCEEDLYLFP
jgi:hypothetical protein